MTKDNAPDPAWKNAALTCLLHASQIRRSRARAEATLGAIEGMLKGTGLISVKIGAEVLRQHVACVENMLIRSADGRVQRSLSESTVCIIQYLSGFGTQPECVSPGAQ